MTLRNSFFLRHQHGTQTVDFPVPDLRSARTVADALARKEIIDCNYYAKGEFQGVTQTLFRVEKDGTSAPFTDFSGRDLQGTLIDLDEVFFFVEPNSDVNAHIQTRLRMTPTTLQVKPMPTALGVTNDIQSEALHVYCLAFALYAGETIPQALLFCSKAVVINRTEFKNSTPNPIGHFYSALSQAHRHMQRFPSNYAQQYSVEAVEFTKQYRADTELKQVGE